jgi:hypothetical protein
MSRQCRHCRLLTRAAATLYPATMTGKLSPRSGWMITPIGSMHSGWALKRDGVVKRSGPDLLPLAAYVDAIMAGADEEDADLIAKAIARRPWPSYEERLLAFDVTGPWRPSRHPFGTGNR